MILQRRKSFRWIRHSLFLLLKLLVPKFSTKLNISVGSTLKFHIFWVVQLIWLYNSITPVRVSGSPCISNLGIPILYLSIYVHRYILSHLQLSLSKSCEVFGWMETFVHPQISWPITIPFSLFRALLPLILLFSCAWRRRKRTSVASGYEWALWLQGGG